MVKTWGAPLVKTWGGENLGENPCPWGGENLGTESLFGVRNVLVKTRVRTRVKTFYCLNSQKKSDGENPLGGAV